MAPAEIMNKIYDFLACFKFSICKMLPKYVSSQIVIIIIFQVFLSCPWPSAGARAINTGKLFYILGIMNHLY